MAMPSVFYDAKTDTGKAQNGSTRTAWVDTIEGFGSGSSEAWQES
jgi:hypothetical protein